MFIITRNAKGKRKKTFLIVLLLALVFVMVLNIMIQCVDYTYMRVDVIRIQYVDGNFSKNPILLQCNIR